MDPQENAMVLDFTTLLQDPDDWDTKDAIRHLLEGLMKHAEDINDPCVNLASPALRRHLGIGYVEVRTTYYLSERQPTYTEVSVVNCGNPDLHGTVYETDSISWADLPEDIQYVIPDSFGVWC